MRLLARMWSFMGRFWQGVIRLPIAFWSAWVVVLGGIFLVPWLGSLILNEVAGRWAGILLAAMGLTALVVVPWLVVGVWRSACHYWQVGYPRIWALLAMLSILWGFTGLWRIADQMAVPILLTVGDLLDGSSTDLEPATLSLSPDGKQLIIQGPLGEGTARNAVDLLKQTSEVREVLLNSLGGLLREAHELAMLIERRKLNTRVTDTCVSACAYVFLAGQERHLSADARLGYHRVSLGALEKLGDDDFSDTLRVQMVAKGIRPDFINEALSVNHTDTWFPIHQELYAAGIITHTDAPDAGPNATPEVLHARDLMVGDPAFAALLEVEPNTHAELLHGLSVMLHDHSVSEAEILIGLDVTYIDLMSNLYTLKAEGAAVLAYAKALLDIRRWLYTERPALCTASGMPGWTEIYRILPEPLRKAQKQAFADLLRSGAGHPEHYPEKPVFLAEAKRLAASLPGFGSERDVAKRILNPQDGAQADPQGACALQVAAQTAVLSWPEPEALSFLRGMADLERERTH